MGLDEGHAGGGFHWNRGGWFGGQLGATVWLVLLGGLLLAQGRAAGAGVLALGLLPNLVGVVLWRHRDRLRPYPALQLLIVAAGLSALAAMLLLWRSKAPIPSLELPSGLWFLLVYPGLMLMFHLQERASRKAAA